MSSGSGTIVPVTPVVASTVISAQLYCTVNDLLLDPAPPAGGVELLYKQIQAASQTILQEIGNFIPIAETRKLQGGGGLRLFVPPLLSLSGVIVNDDTNLASTDFIYNPPTRHWVNGPFSWLEVDQENATNLGGWSTEQEGVEIPGNWGLYSETEVTGATMGAAQTTTTDTTLQFSNAAKASPGLVALVGTEQMALTGYDTPVASVTTLNGAIDASQETIVLTNGALVNIGEIIRSGVEQMRILDIATHTAYVQRGWNKTLRAAHSTGAAVDVYRKFVVVRGVNGTTAATHLISAAISCYKVPADVLFLCKEIATLMLHKAETGYAGKSGNAELGQVYYNDAFPRFDLERVRDHYRIPVAK
jgi:hypothetical protein